VFAVNTDGAGFTNLHSFTALDQTYQTNSDGADPEAGLILSGNTLYGTATHGGSAGRGTVFAINTDGTAFTNLHSLSGSDGASPYHRLLLLGNFLYGTALVAAFLGAVAPCSVFRSRHNWTITPSGTNVILSWPTNVAGFDYTAYALQSTTNLASPMVWSTNSTRAGYGKRAEHRHQSHRGITEVLPLVQ